MRKHLLVSVVLFLAALAAAGLVGKPGALFPTLKSDAAIGKQSGDFYLLPTDQLLRPWGEMARIPGRPVDLTFDSRKRLLAVLDWHSVLLLDGSTGIKIAEIPSRSTSYTGIAFRPGDRELWASETTRSGPDSILVAALDELGRPSGPAEHIRLQGHPVPAGIAFSSDGATAYVAFSRNNSLAVFDAGSRQLQREVPVGMAPFGVSISRKQGKIFVSNVGGRSPRPGDTLAPSSGSEVVSDPATGASSTGTVSMVDLETLAVKEIPAGLHPSGLALSPDEKTLAVSNGHSDSVSLIDTSSLARTDVRIPTWPDNGQSSFLGSQPDASAFAPDGKTLYVACGGNNAIAIVTGAGKKWKVLGAVPTAWFPSAVAVDAEGNLRIISIKGTGNTADGKGTFNSREYEGSLVKIPAPAAPQIAAGTREVQAANMPKFEPAGGVANLASLGIEHVFLIVKENRTYDQVFGDIAKGNGDPKLVFYGRDVTPNHHALAERYVLLDNFHTGGAISFDGHQWLMQAFVSDYVERAFAASPRGYAWNMSDALTIAPTGFFWQGAARPIDLRIYGEFCLPARWDPVSQSAVDMNRAEPLTWSDYFRLYKEGKWQNEVGCRAGVPALEKFMSPRYPNNSTSIPDQIRADEYLRELAEREQSGTLPQLTVLTLNNDHTNGTRPGSPTPRAMVADNDLALGRVVEGISKSRFWPKTLILVVEDDAQNGLDHVDGHRTVALAIGPHIRRGAVDSNFYDHTSMVRTIQEIFRIPPRTRFVAAARVMTSVFTPEADTSAYEHSTPKVSLDEMNPPLQALRGRQLWGARRSLAMNWSEPDDIPQDVLNRILWWDRKGYATPYPRLK
ncbi:MAG TPA: bifunctional YncE family protein/alkaline phosphatase family protein [Bryobacterales bacterium]|nr:bifunctional YncE family protein/alkaline phosphatase family protein [Bryobacterales bacterium]